jgi:hypothetical protein
MRVPVGTIVGLVASGHSREAILRLYPYLEADDILDALSYAAWRVKEIQLPFAVASSENAPKLFPAHKASIFSAASSI